MRAQSLLSPIRFCSRQLLRSFASQQTGKALISVPRIQISSGTSNYLLVSVYIHGETLFARTIVRSHENSHVKLYKKIQSEMEKLGLCTRALGGGKLEMSDKNMKISGMCRTFGRADHYITKDILKSSSKYKNYKIKVKK